MKLPKELCRVKHKDDWDYVEEGSYWCSECKEIRKQK